MNKRIAKIAGIVIASLLLLPAIAYLYRTFTLSSRPVTSNITGPLTLITALLTGALITFLWLQLRNSKRPASSIRSSSHTVIESMKRVFKIVLAEGQLNEIYNYEKTKKLLKIIPSTKKALVIVRAGVMMGYDIEKCKWEIDAENKRIRLLEFPKPEILSIETDFNYYYFEDDLFNFIGRSDLQQMQELAKKQVKKAALKSSLVKIAADQMKLLLSEVVTANQWQIENLSLIDEYSYPELEEEGEEREEAKQEEREKKTKPLPGETETSSTIQKVGQLINKATNLLSS